MPWDDPTCGRLSQSHRMQCFLHAAQRRPAGPGHQLLSRMDGAQPCPGLICTRVTSAEPTEVKPKGQVMSSRLQVSPVLSAPTKQSRNPQSKNNLGVQCEDRLLGGVRNLTWFAFSKPGNVVWMDMCALPGQSVWEGTFSPGRRGLNGHHCPPHSCGKVTGQLKNGQPLSPGPCHAVSVS